METILSSVATQNVISLVLVVVTGIYVVLTWRISTANSRMIDTMSTQFEETIRPFVIAKLSIYEGVVFSLTIENLGKSVARNLQLSMDKDFFIFADQKRNIRNFEAFNRTIPTFSPGEKLVFLLSQGFNMDNKVEGVDLTPSSFLVGANYEFNKKRYEESFLIDTTAYSMTNATKTSSEYLKEISERLKKISEN